MSPTIKRAAVSGTAFITAIQQSGPRGADKLFSTNWIMPMAQRRLGPGQLTLRTMFSLEPATVSGRYYPLLFQQGETAFGKPIIDGQHPHNFPTRAPPHLRFSIHLSRFASDSILNRAVSQRAFVRCTIEPHQERDHSCFAASPLR